MMQRASPATTRTFASHRANGPSTPNKLVRRIGGGASCTDLCVKRAAAPPAVEWRHGSEGADRLVAAEPGLSRVSTAAPVTASFAPAYCACSECLFGYS